jgi:hypothetical protein
MQNFGLYLVAREHWGYLVVDGGDCIKMILEEYNLQIKNKGALLAVDRYRNSARV